MILFTLFICDAQIIINNMKKKIGYSQEPHHYRKENQLMPSHQEDRMREDLFNSMGMPSFATQGTASHQYPRQTSSWEPSITPSNPCSGKWNR